jgi:hypothetical protein
VPHCSDTLNIGRNGRVLSILDRAFSGRYRVNPSLPYAPLSSLLTSSGITWNRSPTTP